jgi:hypothetical protein
MSWLTGLFLLIMLLFAALQYNDPDALLWIAIYGLVAVWCALTLWRPGLLRGTPALRWAALASLAAYSIGFLWLIRTYSAEFLSQSMMAPGVETTREAFGLLSCALVTGYALWVDARTGPVRAGPARA